MTNLTTGLRAGLRLTVASGLLAAALAPAAQAADVAAAQAIVDEYSQLPEFSPPGAPFDATACVEGKKLFSIPLSNSNPFINGISEQMESAAKQVGLEFMAWENQGQPTQWVQGMEYAITNGYDAIDLMGGIPPEALAPQIAAAKEAGMRVYASHYTDVTLPRAESLDVALPLSFSRVGEILAAWVVTQTGGDANVLVIGSDDVPPSQPYWKAFEAKLKELAPEATAKYLNVPTTEWATKIQSQTQSNLLQNPGINFIVPIYDSMSQFVIPALTITGKKGQIPIATFNGTPFVLDMVRNGDVQMNIGESLGWIARSAIDAEMRDLCGMDDVPDELYVPFYIFDESNVASAGDPAEFDKGYGDAYVPGFEALWGLN